jgi:hypothetical protein
MLVTSLLCKILLCAVYFIWLNNIICFPHKQCNINVIPKHMQATGQQEFNELAVNIDFIF